MPIGLDGVSRQGTRQLGTPPCSGPGERAGENWVLDLCSEHPGGVETASRVCRRELFGRQVGEGTRTQSESEEERRRTADGVHAHSCQASVPIIAEVSEAVTGLTRIVSGGEKLLGIPLGCSVWTRSERRPSASTADGIDQRTLIRPQKVTSPPEATPMASPASGTVAGSVRTP